MARLRAFLTRATYDWLVMHEMTPYILVDAEIDGVVVPPEYIEDGKIVLNMAPEAIREVHITDKGVQFDASFSGEAWTIEVPAEAILGMYSRETNQGIYARDDGLGMLVNEAEDGEDPDPTPPKDDPKVKVSERLAKSGLRVVK